MAELMNGPDATSTRPYLIRALYEWCTDNGLTPYVAVLVDESVQVPREFVKNNEIVLNISFDATSSLKLGNDFIEFKARFAGVAREIIVPVGRVLAIYARENGQGIAFPSPPPVVSAGPVTSSPAPSEPGLPNLRAASPAAPEGKVISLGADASKTVEDADPPTEPPKSPAGSRPALKRVK